MSRSRHRTHKIESLEAMILMSGSTIDGMADSDVDPQTGVLMGPVENPELFATGGSSGVTGSGTGFEFSGTGEGGIAVGGDGMFPGGSIGGSPEGDVGGVSPAGGIGIGVSGETSEGIGPISEFDIEPSTDLRIAGDSENEYFDVRSSSLLEDVYRTEFVVSTTADESLPSVFIQEVRIVGDEVWVLSVVAETPYSASSAASGFAIGSVRVPVPEQMHANGYAVREFRIGGAPDGTLSEAIAEVDSIAEFLQLVGDSQSEILYDRDVDGVGFPQPGESADFFGSQFGFVSGDDGGNYNVLPTVNGANFVWQGVLPGIGPLGVDIQNPALGTGQSPETLVVTPRQASLDSEVQPTAFSTRVQLTDSLDELYIEDIRVVGNEVWLLTVAEEGTNDREIRGGSTSHRVEIDIPLELHEQGYNVLEYRTGGPLSLALRDGVQEVDTKADYLALANGQTTNVLYDHSDAEQFTPQQGFAFTDNGEFSLDEVGGDSVWTLIDLSASPPSTRFVGGSFNGTASTTEEFSTGSIGTGPVGNVASDVGGGIIVGSGNPGEGFGGGATDLTATPVNAEGSAQNSFAENVAVTSDGSETFLTNNLSSVGDTTGASTDLDLASESINGGSLDSLAAATGTASGLPIIEGTDNDDWLSAETGSASVMAGAGDDSLHSSLSDSILNGGDGLDTFYVYEGTSADFTIQQTDAGVVVSGLGVNGGTVENTLVDVERIVFNDRDIDLTSLPTTLTESMSGNQIPSVPGFFGGSPNNDAIDGTSNDDEFYASAGSDQIDGGDGIDTLFVYGGKYRNPLGAFDPGTIPDGLFSVNRISANTVVVEGVSSDNSGLRYELTDVERIVFDTQTVYLDGPGYKTLTGTSDGEWLATNECTDFVHAGDGDDAIYLSTLGTRLVNGGGGIDTLLIYEDSTDFRLVDLRDSFGAWWVIGSSGVVDLVDVEFIQFNDQLIATADILPPSPDEGFGRNAAIIPPICPHV